MAFAAAWAGWVGFPLAVRRRAGPVFGVSVPVAVPPSLRLAAPGSLPVPAWVRAFGLLPLVAGRRGLIVLLP